VPDEERRSVWSRCFGLWEFIRGGTEAEVRAVDCEHVLLQGSEGRADHEEGITEEGQWRRYTRRVRPLRDAGINTIPFFSYYRCRSAD